MKQELPKWALPVIIALGLGVLVFVGLRAGSVQELENPNPPAKVIPKHIFDSMDKAAQDALLKQGIEVVDEVEQPQGIPSGAGAATPEQTR
ncbi:MAG: hypothetical protein MH204_11775 [Fimbriimonadaceae bacterium]|nr:hypothetical protein [Fimbriimonadaceae bacterium]